MQEDNNSLFLLEILSNVLQIASYIMLEKDSSNNDIMQELQLQDQLLSEQTNIYLKNIIFSLTPDVLLLVLICCFLLNIPKT